MGMGGVSPEAQQTYTAVTALTTGANTFTDTQTVEQGTLGNSITALSSTATNDNPTVTTYQNRTTTTDATTATLHTITLADETAYTVTAHVVGRRTGGTAGTAGDSIVYLLTDAFMRTGGGGATRIGAAFGPILLFNRRDNPVVDITTDTSGNDVRVRVTGDTNNNYTWHLSELKVSPLSS